MTKNKYNLYAKMNTKRIIKCSIKTGEGKKKKKSGRQK